MNYNNPEKSGRDAFLNGKARNSNPCDIRTSLNARHHWYAGWDEQSKTECKGTNCTAIKGVGHSKECVTEFDLNTA